MGPEEHKPKSAQHLFTHLPGAFIAIPVLDCPNTKKSMMMLIEEIIIICFIIALLSYRFQYSEYLKRKENTRSICFCAKQSNYSFSLAPSSKTIFRQSFFHRL